jgi:hypothetical protein
MRHEIFVIVLVSWLALQIPLAFFVASILRLGSAGPIRNAPSKIKRARIRRNKTVLAHGHL